MGVRLDLGDDALDLLGGLLRTLGEATDLGGDDREAAAVLTGARGLDGGVEGEQVGLLGELVEQLEDAAGLGDALAQALGADGDVVDALGELLDGGRRRRGRRRGPPR